MFNFYRRWRERRDQKLFHDGYDYAVGQLVGNGYDELDDTLDYLHTMVDGANYMGCAGPFEKGVMEAVRDFLSLMQRASA